MKPKVLLVYKDEEDFYNLLKCIENRYGKIIKQSKSSQYSFIEVECVIYYCITLNCDFSFFRGHRYDDIYISHASCEFLTDEIKELLFYGLHDLEYNGFKLDLNDSNNDIN